MREELGRILSSVDADYADLRYETKHETQITFTGRDLTQVGSSRGDGFVFRVLAGGGMASVVFTRPEDAGYAVAAATRNAKLIGRHSDTPVALAPAPPVVDAVKPDLVEDPRSVSLEEKIDLTWRLLAGTSGKNLLEGAFSLMDRFSLSWWDSLIVSAAQASGCGHLLTEDLQEGQVFDRVEVVNPLSRTPREILGDDTG